MILKKGSNKELIKKVQAQLGLKPDGDYGSMTTERVKSFQLKNNLIVNGIVDDIVWSKLFNEPLIMKDISDYTNNLIGIMPYKVMSEIEEVMRLYKIDTPLKLIHFLAQCAHESNNFKETVENLNYSASGLLKTFPKYFNASQAKLYAKKPVNIASRVYANRMGNGNEESQDGWKYKGKGYIQLTGKANHIEFGKYIGADFIENPELIASDYPLSSAAYFFYKNKIWSVCEKGSSNDIIMNVTKIVNGGQNGLDDRIKYFNKYYNLLNNIK